MAFEIATTSSERTKPRWYEAIWHIEGVVPMGEARSADEAFDRLAPLFRHTGTTVRQRGDTLAFDKTDPDAQDPLAVFDRGTIEATTAAGEPVLRYRMVSRALLFCFFAPLLFLAFAQATVLVAAWTKPSAEEAAKAEKKQIQLPQNWIDKALGAPAPEPKKKKEAGAGDDKKPKPTAAYIFAGIFAFLYVVGRLLESRLVRQRIITRLSGNIQP
ncbi:hypothetical protein [Sphingomonas adhaesiva]|uniref:hypothetical protein n=1 Tax=Sphingomonas adhaesiva TaxID=28212 RepID=UPI002FF6DEAA